MQYRAVAEDGKVDFLLAPHLLGMAGQPEERLARPGPEQGQQHPGKEGEEDALPEHQADALLLAAAGVLGDEHPDIAAHPAEESDEQIGGDAGGQRRRDRLDAVVGKEDAVGEFHGRGGREADHQGETDAQHRAVETGGAAAEKRWYHDERNTKERETMPP